MDNNIVPIDNYEVNNNIIIQCPITNFSVPSTKFLNLVQKIGIDPMEIMNEEAEEIKTIGNRIIVIYKHLL